MKPKSHDLEAFVWSGFVCVCLEKNIHVFLPLFIHNYPGTRQLHVVDKKTVNWGFCFLDKRKRKIKIFEKDNMHQI